ncbi:hypothetical protein OHR68_35400 [Spirillospora sp. NBC_00431]
MLPGSQARRLTIVQQFFRFAKTHKIVLVDPTRPGACRPSNPGDTSARPSPSTSNANCSGSGPPTRPSIRTKAGRSPASTAYVSHVQDACGVPPRMLRSTRLVDLVNTMDPKLVAAAFGMDPEDVMIYLADHIDPSQLTEKWAR